jgi:hypothetical protein
MFNDRVALGELTEAGNIAAAIANATDLVNELAQVLASENNDGREAA